MREEISAVELIELLNRMCLDMETVHEKLQELDAKVGDGDLGVTVRLGFKAVREILPQLADKDIGTILIQSGMAFNKAGASTFGTLVATAFIRAGHEVKDKKKIEVKDVTVMLKRAIEGIKERGKASQGECTMLDALIPAKESLCACSNKNQTLSVCMVAAEEAAEKGAESTTEMKARHGRAGWLGKRSVGVPDAGAVAIALMFRSASRFLNEESQ